MVIGNSSMVVSHLSRLMVERRGVTAATGLAGVPHLLVLSLSL
jgi:hypothetical protein